jgi:hypothetical protein
VVGDVHDLAEHLVRRVGDADVVPERLTHLHGTVGADQEGCGKNALGDLAIVLHHVAPHEEVVELVGPTELHVGVDGDRVVGLHQRVEELGQRDRVPGSVAFAEVVALEDAGDGRRAGQLYDVRHREGRQPLGVVANLGAIRVEDHVGLLEVGARVLLYLLR